MPARPLVSIITQLGVEVTPGTAVAANRIIRSLSFMPKLRRETKPFRPRGYKFATLSTPHKVWGEGNYEGVGCYNGILYVCSGLLPHPTPTAVGASAAKKWTYIPNTRQEDDTRKTYTFEVGSAVTVDKFAFGQLASMEFSLTQDDVAISGNLFARKPVFNQVQTVSPTEIAARPIQRGQINVYLDTTFGSIGTTKITDAAQETISMGDKWHPTWAHNTSSSSFRDTVEVAPDLNFSFVTPHNSQSRAYLDALDTNALQYMRIECIGDQISLDGATPVLESVKFDIAGKFTQPDDDEEQDTYARKFNFQALDDSSLGGAFKVEVVNLIAAL